MSDKLDQLQADFVPNEDRILLKLRAGDKLYRAWITRRYAKLLIPMLQGLHPMTGERFAEAPALPLEQAEAITPEKEAPLEQQQQSYTFPLGESSILLVEASYQAPSQDRPAQLVLNPAQGAGIVLPYDPTLNYSLLTLLKQTTETAQWALDTLFEIRPGDPLQ